ncbi:hypothetical protein SK128_004784 [Halocaridina rubra]|uniref:Uncharacterized protein n=1 Tax=Halocaridina rubra TaxID=373956 RepID=A0AAN8WLL2_HALRR
MKTPLWLLFLLPALALGLRTQSSSKEEFGTETGRANRGRSSHIDDEGEGLSDVCRRVRGHPPVSLAKRTQRAQHLFVICEIHHDITNHQTIVLLVCQWYAIFTLDSSLITQISFL